LYSSEGLFDNDPDGKIKQKERRLMEKK